MRVLAITALALLLAGCNGDRMNSTNTRQAPPQTTGLLT
jgi:PBP1b-binding outer membrane lipoprotein LpoB